MPPARVDEDESPPAAAAGSDGRKRRGWLPVAAVLVLVALVGLVLLTRGGADPGTEDGDVVAPLEDSAGDSAPTGVDGEDAGEPTADGEDAPDDAGEGDTDGDDADDDPADTEEDPADTGDGDAVPEADVPGDWKVVEGPAYEVAVPSDWEVTPGQGRLVDHADPDSSTYLRVDWTPDPQPDPYQNWVEFDRSLADRFQDYERIQLTELTFRGEPAALLEYTYTAGGVDLRAYNLNLLAGDRAYALNLQSRAQDWDEVEPMFASIVGGFQPE